MSWTYYDKGLETTGHPGTSGSTHSFHGISSINIGGGGQGGGGFLWLSGSTQRMGTPGTPRTNPGGGGGGCSSRHADSTPGVNGRIWLFYNHDGQQ